MKTETEKQLLKTLVSVTKALGRLIDETQSNYSHLDTHPELKVLEKAFEVIGENSETNLFV